MLAVQREAAGCVDRKWKRGEMEKDEDVTFGGMQTHMERCQKSQANKSSGWNSVYVAEE